MIEKEQDEFIQLIAAFQSNDLTEVELAKLENDLVNDAERRRLFIEIQRRSTAIAEEFQKESLTTLAHVGDEPRDDLSDDSDNSKSVRIPIVRFLLVIAAALLIVIAWRLVGPDESRIAKVRVPVSFAKLTYSDGAVWRQTESNAPVLDGQLNQEIAYQLVSGSVRLQMLSGGIVTLAGPSSFKGIGPGEIQVLSGKFAARLPTPQSELMVRVGEMTVRDLGTAFGITVQPDGDFDLSVFEGTVVVQSANADGDIQEHRLEEGNSVMAVDDSLADVDVPFDTAKYEDIWPLTIGVDDASSIIEFTRPGPQQPLTEHANSSKLLLIPEQLNKQLGQSVDLQLLRPGKSWPESLPQMASLPANQVVSSYLLVYVPEAADAVPRQSISGTVSFQKNILGVVIQNGQLEKSDRLVGVSEIDYGSLDWRRLERDSTDGGNVPADSLVISPDGKHLRFTLHVSTGQDCIRVLVDEGYAR